METKQVNPNDFKVVQFTNKTDFTFTPDMGCMYDGRPISGITGAPGINGGESMTLPYHIGRQLSVNLAKIVKLRRAPTTDEVGNPVGKPLWSDEDLKSLGDSFITEMYSEVKPTAISETDRLMAKVEEYKKMVEHLLPPTPATTETTITVANSGAETTTISNTMSVGEVTTTETVVIPPVTVRTNNLAGFVDKQEVIAELERRQIKFDRRQSKANLEKLLK